MNKNNQKEITIIPPEGYEIDKEKSTFDKIVLKKKEETKTPWRYDNNALINGWLILHGTSVWYIENAKNEPYNKHIFATDKQASSAIAMARISQIIANDKRFGGPVTNEEWEINTPKFCICNVKNNIETDTLYIHSQFLAFHSSEQRDLFLKENEDLVKEYLMID